LPIHGLCLSALSHGGCKLHFRGSFLRQEEKKKTPDQVEYAKCNQEKPGFVSDV